MSQSQMTAGRIAVSVVSLLLLVGVVVGVVMAVKNNGDSHHESKTTKSSTKAVISICEVTNYKEACASSLHDTAKNASASTRDYILAAIHATHQELEKALEAARNVTVADKDKDHADHVALEDCKEFLEDAIDVAHTSMSMVQHGSIEELNQRGHELLSWMTATYAYQTTCLDQISNPQYKSAVHKALANATQLAHNAVNIVAEMPRLISSTITLGGTLQDQYKGGRLLQQLDDGGYPKWLHVADRKLLAAQAPIKPNVGVAKDGSGHFKTIGEAIAAYPKKYEGRFIIYVKAGVYDEQVIIDKKMPNIFMYGDGIGRTIVTGRKNYAIQHIGTMHTSTFSNKADGFIARGITFKNEAGPEGHQAVAFLNKGDMVALFDCSFEAHQDTLYYQFRRQFYRNCRIYGTIDFIFGKGDAVIQDSEIVARRPLPNQFNTVTADGREIPRGSNGLVIQNCRIVPDNFLFPQRFVTQTFLGRPWTPDALTVVMQSELGDFIRPEGWKLWDGSDNHKTCEMYEFANRGPGAATNKRHKQFARFKVLNAAEATKFTPGVFLSGAEWLPKTGVPYRLGL